MTAELGDWQVETALLDRLPSASKVDVGELGREITLTVAGAGSIAVSASGCVTSAVDAAGHAKLLSVGEHWAWGQWLALNGVAAFNGVTLARDGVGVAIFGPPRAGMSFTALALASRGWHLVADGVCPLRVVDGELIATPGRPFLELDKEFVMSLVPPAYPFELADTPRERWRVEVPTTTAHRIDLIVFLWPRPSRNEAVVIPATTNDADESLMLAGSSVAGAAIYSANDELKDGLRSFCEAAVVASRCVIALVPSNDNGARFLPREVAELIEDSLASSNE
jgi:hypothetical protein